MNAEPDRNENQDASPEVSREQQEADDECFLQWVALAVLLGCWLAEAYV